MNFINYISNIAIPFTIVFIVFYGILEHIKVFDSFLEGAKDGMKIIYNIFPTLLGLFLSINILEESGIIDAITNISKPLLLLLNFPPEILPLAILRPISGSASMAVATNIDVLAAGISMAIYQVNIWLVALFLTAFVSAAVSLGFTLGSKLGKMFGSKAEMAGGIVLILLSIKVFLEG